jgi:protein SCO1/2
LVAALLAAAGCGREPKLEDLGTVGDFRLTDQSGQTFESKARLTGKVWIAAFIYTHCNGPCPLMSARMRRLQEATAAVPNLRLVSFTVDPERDTPPVLAAYAGRFHAQPGRWFFLTGSQAELQRLNRQALKLGDVDATLEHSTRLVLVDGRSHIRGYYHSGDPDSIAKLMDDIGRLGREKSS